ncbi:MAG: nuclear transport factor 2 family protein, partial [Candidatus Acidiferrales bacterium]
GVMSDALAVVRAFIERINAHDVEGLCALMTPDHALVDSLDATLTGAANMRAAWETYFLRFPDYRIAAEYFFAMENQVAVFGDASATFAPDGDMRKENFWQIPAAWLATMREGRVAVWRVYADNQPARSLMQQHAPSKAVNG